jgi:hypothetical protein
MDKLESDLQKSIESAKELLIWLESIECNSPLTSVDLECVRKDIESINTVIQLLEQPQSKEQIREVWNYFRFIPRNFGGNYWAGLEFKLESMTTRLWDNLLNLLADSQEVNKTSSK